MQNRYASGADLSVHYIIQTEKKNYSKKNTDIILMNLIEAKTIANPM